MAYVHIKFDHIFGLKKFHNFVPKQIWSMIVLNVVQHTMRNLMQLTELAQLTKKMRYVE